MAQLSNLPSELVEHILAHLAQPAFYSLSQVSKSLYAITTPYLYRDINLLAPAGSHVPRVDKLFFNILDDPKLGKHVQSLRVGPSPEASLHEYRRRIPKESKAQHQLSFQKAMSFVKQQDWIADADDIREALWSNDYGAYTALLFLALPTLQCISIAENGDETLRPLHNLLDSIKAGAESAQSSDARYITSIKEVVYNFDSESATAYPASNQSIVWQALVFPTVQKLEFAVLINRGQNFWWQAGRIGQPPLQVQPQLTSLTSLTIRHSWDILESLKAILQATPLLRSLTCEAWCDSRRYTPGAQGNPWRWIDLEEWSKELRTVRGTLTTLVISVESCNGDETFFRQPNITPHIFGRLDLSGFDQLHTLEVPVNLLICESFLWIGMDMNYAPLAPPNLRHLTLRTDMTGAQFVYPWDTSIMPTGPTLQESIQETNLRDGARMDLSSVIRFAIALTDQLPCLQSFAVWQPPDPSLDFFDNQLEDLRISCQNKSITAKVIYPMLLRWKSAVHWNLVREVTLFDHSSPTSEPFARLFRGERHGIPLGLATQYHLGEFKKNHVRRFR